MTTEYTKRLKRTAHRPGAGVRTATELRNANRRLDRHRAGAAKVLGAMKRGASLHLQYTRGRSLWSVSTGEFVTAEAAAIVTANPAVVGVDCGLFRDAPGQTWRFVEEETR